MVKGSVPEPIEAKRYTSGQAITVLDSYWTSAEGAYANWLLCWCRDVGLINVLRLMDETDDLVTVIVQYAHTKNRLSPLPNGSWYEPLPLGLERLIPVNLIRISSEE